MLPALGARQKYCKNAAASAWSSAASHTQDALVFLNRVLHERKP